MEDFKNNKKVLYIPGWLDKGERHGFRNNLDIWSQSVNIERDFGVDYVIAHSVGCLVALANWHKHRDFKMIFINPVIFKKNIFRRWLDLVIREGIPESIWASINPFLVIPGLVTIFWLFQTPAAEIIKRLPRDRLLVIYGENDRYLLDNGLIDNFRKQGFKVKALPGVGHNYDPKFDEVIEQTLKRF